MKFVALFIFRDGMLDAKDTKQQTYMNKVLPATIRAAAQRANIKREDFDIQWFGDKEFMQTFGIEARFFPAAALKIEGEKKATFVIGYRNAKELEDIWYTIMTTGEQPDEKNVNSGKLDTDKGKGKGTGDGTGDGKGKGNCNSLLNTIIKYAATGAAVVFGAKALSSKEGQVLNGSLAVGAGLFAYNYCKEE